jgi:hypothetical protein
VGESSLAGEAAKRWVLEAERLHRRYLIEIVEECGLCPWAERARVGGRTRVAVLLDADDASVAPSIAAIDGWAVDDEVEIGFLVFPRLALPRVEFDRFVARLQQLDADRHPLGDAPFAMAAFHPQGEANVEDAERLIPFLRRTPDPCVQLVRMSALKRVRTGTPEGTQYVDMSVFDPSVAEASPATLRERIARANLNTVRRMGVAELAGRIDAIHRDRARSYRALVARDRGEEIAP